MYCQFAPPDDLKPFIYCFYEMRCDETKSITEVILPTGNELMGWKYGGDWSIRWWGSGRNATPEHALPAFFTIGQQTTSYCLSATGSSHTGIIGVRLHPGTLWYGFQCCATRFTQRVTDTGSLVTYQLLHTTLEDFHKANGTTAKLSVLVNFYRKLLAGSTRERSFVEDALARIFQSKGATTVRDICNQLGIHERYLQRHFKTQVGITMQQLIRILRFNSVFVMINSRHEELAIELIALLHNYYDQSHFYKEYKNFMGDVPSQLELDQFAYLKTLVSDNTYPKSAFIT